MTEELKVPRPALRYFGGKWLLAPWIISNFPGHKTYVEPFGGGANVLLRKAPSKFEIYNDIDSNVVNFFRVLREDHRGLARLISLTPFSREEFLLAMEPIEDPIERARVRRSGSAIAAAFFTPTPHAAPFASWGSP
jgi:DNA adenine methylase